MKKLFIKFSLIICVVTLAIPFVATPLDKSDLPFEDVLSQNFK
ncbi:hypothetical protein ACFP7A_07940 [Sporolactobacillus kofuensis]|uniref:Uncharacterized protein n=1 Tax=Sporolactobacillus kofuensis TaxID=269672 RepID=A0ABW1WHC0_9BACL|nr:hypothetical protein [Sporolactobacillus kofuensis]